MIQPRLRSANIPRGSRRLVVTSQYFLKDRVTIDDSDLMRSEPCQGSFAGGKGMEASCIAPDYRCDATGKQAS